MRDCPQCKAQVPDDAAFCTNCGMKISAVSTTATQPSTPNDVAPTPPGAPQYSPGAYPPSSPPPSYQYPAVTPYRQPGTVPHPGMPMATTPRKAPMTGRTYVLLFLLGLRIFFNFLNMDLLSLIFLILYGVALILVLMRHPWGGITAIIAVGLDIAIGMLFVLQYPEILGYILVPLIVDFIIAAIGYNEYQDCNKYQKALAMTTMAR